MAGEPDLPIVLNAFNDRWKKIERLRENLRGMEISHIAPPARGFGEKEKKLWDAKHKERNCYFYKYDEIISKWQQMIAEREKRVVERLREIFLNYECPYLDWEALTWKLVDTPAYHQAWPVPPSQLKRVKGHSAEEWRVLALELTLVCGLFTVEPLAEKPADRAADLKRTIALMMAAQLGPNPGTGHPASPSVSQAAASVRAKLLKMAEDGASGQNRLKEIPSVSRIRNIYYDKIATLENIDSHRYILIQPSSQMQKYMKVLQALYDLKKIAIRCEAAHRLD